MNEISLSNYGPTFTSLLADAPLNELGPSQPLVAQRKKLESLSIDTAFAPHKVVDRTMAKACLAGLWLRFDFLDESHAISQEIKTTSGSYWHGVMHRRELDYDNAKYWFHRVGEHAVFAPLCAAGRNVARATNPADPAAKLLTMQTQWDPFRFIDLVAAATHGKSPNEQLCREIQRIEWALLFDFCFRAAIEQAS
jgi:hypothetical protein